MEFDEEIRGSGAKGWFGEGSVRLMVWPSGWCDEGWYLMFVRVNKGYAFCGDALKFLWGDDG